MRRWVPSISPSIWLAGRLTKRAEVSARNVSNLNLSSNSVYMVSIDSCICQSRCPQSPSLVLKAISLVIVPSRLSIIYLGFPYSYHFHGGGVKCESRQWMGITQRSKMPETRYPAKRDSPNVLKKRLYLIFRLVLPAASRPNLSDKRAVVHPE